jgi:DNA polymerase III delta subunit
MATARTREPDPPNQLRALARRLEQESLPRAALLRGEERYFIERGVDLLLQSAKDQALEICRHDVSDPEFVLSNLLDDLVATPMFASARLVLVRNADVSLRGTSILKKQGTKASPFTRAAQAFLESGREGCLIITGSKIRADHALAKTIAGMKAPLLSCRKLWDTPPPWDPDPRRAELAQWVGTRANELGLGLSPDDCAYLAMATGNDLSAIDTQLEKVRREGRESLREVVGWQSCGTPWKAADDLLCGDVGRGIAAVEALFREGFHSRDGKIEKKPATLAMIVLSTARSKARQALRGARALARGASMDQAATEVGVSKQKLAREGFIKLAQLRGAAAWERVYCDVLETERRSRTGSELRSDDFFNLALRWRVETRGRRAGNDSRGRRLAPSEGGRRR